MPPAPSGARMAYGPSRRPADRSMVSRGIPESGQVSQNQAGIVTQTRAAEKGPTYLLIHQERTSPTVTGITSMTSIVKRKTRAARLIFSGSTNLKVISQQSPSGRQ